MADFASCSHRASWWRSRHSVPWSSRRRTESSQTGAARSMRQRLQLTWQCGQQFGRSWIYAFVGGSPTLNVRVSSLAARRSPWLGISRRATLWERRRELGRCFGWRQPRFKGAASGPRVPAGTIAGERSERSYAGLVISTDPPYYDNVTYSALSDFFYVWLRRVAPRRFIPTFSHALVPKAEELVANPFRHGSKAQHEASSRMVFERCLRVRGKRHTRVPDHRLLRVQTVRVRRRRRSIIRLGNALEGMIRSGWEITSTGRCGRKPSRMRAGSNALASSIVLVSSAAGCGASTTDRRGFIAALEAELPTALRQPTAGSDRPGRPAASSDWPRDGRLQSLRRCARAGRQTR